MEKTPLQEGREMKEMRPDLGLWVCLFWAWILAVFSCHQPLPTCTPLSVIGPTYPHTRVIFSIPTPEPIYCLLSYVTLDKLFNFSETQFPYL